MSKSVRATLSLFVFLFSSASTFLLLSRCGAGDGPGSEEAGYAFEYTGAFDAPAAEAALLIKTITFNLKWSESGGELNGEYSDDHFSTTSATVSGTISNGVRTLVISLPKSVDGVVAFVMTTEQTSGELGESINLSSLKAEGPGSKLVFEHSGITIKAIKITPASPSTPGADGDVGKFFSEIAKEYDYYANNTSGTGDGTPWSHGKQYKIVIRTDGSITIPTNTAPLELKYDAATGDKYEKYDHEDYAIFKQDDGSEVLAQRVAASGELFLTDKIKDGAFWKFQKDDPGALPSKWATLGVAFVTGTHKHKITATYPTDDTEHKVGDPVEIVIGADGGVTGTFGEFKLDEDDPGLTQGTSGDVPFATVQYYRPSKDEYPRYRLEITFNEEKFAKASLLYQVAATGSDGTKSWQADTQK